MKKLLLALLAVTVTGCAGNQVFKAQTQNYRLKGDTNSLTVNGAIFKKQNFASSDYAVAIYLNEVKKIEFALDKNLNGEGNGDKFNDKSTSATCHGTRIDSQKVSVNCMVFIDNERTVTLTF